MHLGHKLRRAASSKAEISYIGGGAGVGYTTIPSHQAGDLILVQGYYGGPMSVPSGWTGLVVNAAVGDRYALVYYKISASSSEAIDTGDGANPRAIAVYRSTGSGPTIGATNLNTGTVNPRTYGALTLTDAPSMVVAFGWTRRGTTNDPPTGTVKRSESISSIGGSIGNFDTDGPVSSWTNQNVSDLSLEVGWATYTVELVA